MFCGELCYLTKYVAKDGEIFLSDNLPDVTTGLFGQVAGSEASEPLPALQGHQEGHESNR